MIGFRLFCAFAGAFAFHVATTIHSDVMTGGHIACLMVIANFCYVAAAVVSGFIAEILKDRQ